MDNNDLKMTTMSQPPPYTAYPGGVPPPQTSAVIVAQPVAVPVVVGRQMGPDPAQIVCKSCNAHIVTRVEKKATLRTHLFALLLCLVFWPCVCVPYCMDSCNNVNHYCPNCNAYIGSYAN